MCSTRKHSVFRRLTFRLTLWYSVLVGTISLAVFVVVYIALTSSLRQQTDADLRDTAKELVTLFESHGIESLQAEFQREAESRGTEKVFFQLWSTEGQLLATSDLTAWGKLTTAGLPPGPAPKSADRFELVPIPGRSGAVRCLSHLTSDGHVIRIGTTLQETEKLMKKYRETFGVAFVLMLLSGSLVGWVVARRAMSGVERVTQTAIRIGQGELDRRVPLGREGEEIDNLALAFNEMLERIQAAVAELKEVTNHVAHDLRSPITRIRGIAELTLTGDADRDAYREMAGTVVEESDRLVVMINTMLEIAQTESGLGELSIKEVDMREIVEDARDLFQPVADDRSIRLQVNTPPATVMVRGDVSRLQRVLANLLDNAIKYTPTGGSVRVEAEVDGPRVIVKVIDTGDGIASKDLPRIFDRFYRADRHRPATGNGLGLSLARAIVRAHGGDIRASSSPGEGSELVVVLPRAD